MFTHNFRNKRFFCTIVLLASESVENVLENNYRYSGVFRNIVLFWLVHFISHSVIFSHVHIIVTFNTR